MYNTYDDAAVNAVAGAVGVFYVVWLLICLAIEVCIWFLPITGSLSMNLRPVGIFVILAHLVMIFSFIKYVKALDKKYMKEPAFSGWAVFAILIVLCLLVSAWIFILMNS